MQHAFAPQAPGVLGAFTHFFAALQHDGLEPHLRQQQRGKNPAGTKTHHHGAHGRGGFCLGNGVVSLVGCGANVWVACQALQQRSFLRRVAERHVDDVDQQQLLLAGVVAAFVNGVAVHSAGGKPQCLCNQGAQGGFKMVKRQLEFGQSEHGENL